MKTLITLLCWFLLILSCTDRDIVERKDGISLPTVSNLVMQPLDETHVRLSWDIPPAIPDEIEQPIAVYLEVREVLDPTRIVSVFNITLANAPTEFTYDLPDPEKTYHLTVKLNGTTKIQDKNYSSNIFSLGQTVVYNEGQ